MIPSLQFTLQSPSVVTVGEGMSNNRETTNCYLTDRAETASLDSPIEERK